MDKSAQFLNAAASISVTLLSIKTLFIFEQSAKAFFDILVTPPPITTILISALYLFQGILSVVKSCICPLPFIISVPLLSNNQFKLLFIPKMPLSFMPTNVTATFTLSFGIVKVLFVIFIVLPLASVTVG